MIDNPTVALARGTMATEPLTTTGVIDRVAWAVTKGLVTVPVGPSPLTEAAYAWNRLRNIRVGSPHPSPEPASPELQTRVPVVETQREEVAVRLALLLSGLTWATIRRVEPPTASPQPTSVCVDVHAKVYHHVRRSLSAAWRDAQDLWNRPKVAEKDLHAAAVSLWRMAMLLDGIGPIRGVISLRVGTRAEAGLLAKAGECLDVLPSLDRVRGGLVVVVCSPGQVLRLLSEAGAGDPARAWAKARPYKRR